ncbi:MAG: HlyC/CorC family transporter [Gammaproteobacteria bacterium]|nr:HlyC/CorC family transporter [Gammaproteobacteria bacterium]
MFLWEILTILFLTVLNGFFAMSEMALVSARRARLQVMADEGDKGAQAALELAAAPEKLLSSVQIGITLIGIGAGAFGGATLSQKLSDTFRDIAWLAPAAEELGFGLTVALITYLSLILGELVPKNLALRNPEKVAARVARPMAWVAALASPIVSLLSASSALVLRLFGRNPVNEQTITNEEVKEVLAEAAEAGVVEHAEKAMIAGVMRLADRPVSAVMTPRTEVTWLDLNGDEAEHIATLRASSFSRFPVCRGGIDEVEGIVQAKDLLNGILGGHPLQLEETLRAPLMVPGTASALNVLELLKQAPIHMALVVDEYGSLDGVVSTTDILSAIVGSLSEHGEIASSEIIERADGSWLVEGYIALDEFKEHFGFKSLPEDEDSNTLAGWILSRLQHLPTAGEFFDWAGYRFEVVDMDGRRVDKILVSKPASDAESDGERD